MHLVVELSNITTITTVGVKTIKVAESRQNYGKSVIELQRNFPYATKILAP